MKTSALSKLSLAALLLAGSAAALGAPRRAHELATRPVKLKDLDLGTAVGVQKLYERIELAARSVCRDSAPMYPVGVVFECRTRAVEAAVKQVGHPLLSAIHRSTVDRVEEVVLR
jgi:UrcA family protein